MNFIKSFLRGLAALPNLIQQLETLFGAGTGAQKKAAAISLVGSAINITDAVAQKQIADEGGFTAGLEQLVDGVVACLNASIWAKAPVTDLGAGS